MDGVWRFDLEAFRAVHLGLRSPFSDVFFLVFSYLGLGQVQAALALLLLRWRELRPMVAPLLWTIVVSGLLIGQGFKAFVERERPSHLAVTQPQEAWLFNSFPSGHTTTAFGFAFTVLFLTWRTPRRWWGPVALGLAVLVGVSRIYRGVHWPTDTLGGFFAGLFGACLVQIGFRIATRFRKPREAPA